MTQNTEHARAVDRAQSIVILMVGIQGALAHLKEDDAVVGEILKELVQVDERVSSLLAWVEDEVIDSRHRATRARKET